MGRLDGRKAAELRPLKITRGYLKFAEGSALVELGDTWVVCSASVEDKVPPFLRGTGKGWVTAEYGMLPRATPTRNPRDPGGRGAGRSFEIQRLIGRSLRAVTLLEALGERTVWVDCDVIQADGGTRTAAVTGGFVALVEALETLRRRECWPVLPVSDFLAAVSVGLLDASAVLDLTFDEDCRARVDMNVVMSGRGGLVEVQGTGEQGTFTAQEMEDLLELARHGIALVVQRQREALGPLADQVGRGCTARDRVVWAQDEPGVGEC
ncbi:MAG: ribonuclease PH [Acetobacteraceae bacterium]|nr:ribonuclease PH [Acetobacteraceae bacterium]